MAELRIDRQIFTAAERLMVRAYLDALASNEERDWAFARELRVRYDKLRVELGLGPDLDIKEAYWPPSDPRADSGV